MESQFAGLLQCILPEKCGVVACLLLPIFRFDSIMLTYLYITVFQLFPLGCKWGSVMELLRVNM